MTDEAFSLMMFAGTETDITAMRAVDWNALTATSKPRSLPALNFSGFLTPAYLTSRYLRDQLPAWPGAEATTQQCMLGF